MSKGETNQSEIVRILQVDRSIVCMDVTYFRLQAKENIARYVDKRLSESMEMPFWIKQHLKRCVGCHKLKIV